MWLGRQSPNRYLNPTPGRVSPMFSRSTVDFSNGFVWNVREKTPTLSKIWMFKHWLIIFLLHWMGRIGVYWRYIPCSNQLKFAMGVLSLAKTILAHSNLYNTWLTFWMNIYMYICVPLYIATNQSLAKLWGWPRMAQTACHAAVAYPGATVGTTT